MDSGAVKKHQKRFQNVVNEPLITGEHENLILGLIALPELHIMIGDTFILYKFVIYLSRFFLFTLSRCPWQNYEGYWKNFVLNWRGRSVFHGLLPQKGNFFIYTIKLSFFFKEAILRKEYQGCHSLEVYYYIFIIYSHTVYTKRAIRQESF